MTALHLVNHASALDACLSVAGEDDAILLLEDGVYAATTAAAPSRALHALEPDVRARALAGRLAENVSVISDAQFVTLVEDHQPVVTWR